MSHSGGPEGLRADYQSMAQALVRRLAALPEESMRSTSWVRELGHMGPLQAVWTLEWLIRATLEKEPPALEVYEGMADPMPIVSAMGMLFADAMEQAGFEEGCVAALIWLGSTRLVPPESETADASRLVHFQLREMTLGDRRALARRARGDNLKRLLVDPDPGVIANLLNNPRTTEETVLALCSRRPTVSPALEVVMRTPRWFRRYRVKRALVHNPHLALRCSVNLLPFLSVSDICDIRSDGTLAAPLRLASQRLLDLVSTGST